MSTFGISYSELSGQINVGHLNTAGTAFTSKESLTDAVLLAVAHYVMGQFNGGLRMDFTNNNTGGRITLEVRAVEVQDEEQQQ